MLHDAAWDADFRRALFEAIAGETSGSGAARLVAKRGAGFDDAEAARLATDSRVLKADQSNTAIVYGSSYLLKLYRKIERGPNPDADVTRYLSEVRQFPNVPSFGGSIALEDSAGSAVLGLMVGFTPNEGDGWSHALDSVARYFDRVFAAATPESRVAGQPPSIECDSEHVQDLIGGVYPDRARQLGQRTGELHLALAAGADTAGFEPEPFTTLWQRSLYQAMRGSIGRTFRVLRQRLPHLPENAREIANSVLAAEAELLTRQGRLLTRKIQTLKTVVHGDYHLGQVLNTGKDFVIIDFEGEPRRSLGERTLKRSPLIDVAGMLRSFDYVAHVAVSNRREDDARFLQPWAAAWVQTISDVFLRAYLETTKGAPFIPDNEADMHLLLEAFILDKAIYEVGYELAYRPEFAAIPLRAVQEILDKGSD